MYERAMVVIDEVDAIAAIGCEDIRMSSFRLFFKKDALPRQRAAAAAAACLLAMGVLGGGGLGGEKIVGNCYILPSISGLDALHSLGCQVLAKKTVFSVPPQKLENECRLMSCG